MREKQEAYNRLGWAVVASLLAAAFGFLSPSLSMTMALVGLISCDLSSSCLQSAVRGSPA